jgi:hypothetical protein
MADARDPRFDPHQAISSWEIGMPRPFARRPVHLVRAALRSGMGLLGALLLAATSAFATDHLIYIEAQGVAGYDFRDREVQYFSMNPQAEMQKPSIGFDYLQRFSGESGDWGSAGLQVRLAVVEDKERFKTIQPQVYNAWVRAKSPLTDAWVGHYRPAFGLGSYFDSHALLLRTLPIQGFGYDRDWGVGIYRDFSWGNLQLSATTGSGMPIELRGNYMLAGRVSWGVLSQDNFNLGASVGYGRTLDTMGYTLRDPDPQPMRLGGVDFTLLRDALEHRFDILGGEWLGKETLAVMYRLSWVVDGEGRTRLEAQPAWWKSGEQTALLSVCVSHLLTPDLTGRLMYEYDTRRGDQRVVLQLYWYRRL